MASRTIHRRAQHRGTRPKSLGNLGEDAASTLRALKIGLTDEEAKQELAIALPPPGPQREARLTPRRCSRCACFGILKGRL